MVKVEIVEEKDSGSSPYASSSSSHTSSSVSLSSVSSELSAEETFFERVAALVDIVPPTTRHSISSRISKTASFIKRGGKIAGNIVWIVTTSALLVALPLALSLEDEAKIVAQEAEMLEQQQGAQQVNAPLLAFATPANPAIFMSSRDVYHIFCCSRCLPHQHTILPLVPIRPSRRALYLPAFRLKLAENRILLISAARPSCPR